MFENMIEGALVGALAALMVGGFRLLINAIKGGKKKKEEVGEEAPSVEVTVTSKADAPAESAYASENEATSVVKIPPELEAKIAAGKKEPIAPIAPISFSPDIAAARQEEATEVRPRQQSQPLPQEPVQQPVQQYQPVMPNTYGQPYEPTGKSTAHPPVSGAAPAQLSYPQLYLRCLRGEHQGRIFPLDSQRGTPCHLGRSPQAAVRFNPATPGVSGNHCTVIVRSSVVYDYAGAQRVYTSAQIMDRGSTYGTFLLNPQQGGAMKLAANVPHPLNPGSIFTIGSPEGPAFRLEEKGVSV